MLRSALACLTVLAAPSAYAAKPCEDALARADREFAGHHRSAAQLTAAREAFEAAAADPGCAYAAHWRLARLHLASGMSARAEARRLGQFGRGEAHARAAIATRPDGKEGHYFLAANLGSAIRIEGPLLNLGRVREVRAATRRALQLDGCYAPALVIESRFLTDLPGVFGGDEDEAERLLRKAVRCGPTIAVVHVELARFLALRDRDEEARRLLDRVSAPGFRHALPALWHSVGKARARAVERLLAQATP